VAQEFTLPEVGEGVESGTVVALLVAEGDRIEIDQPVLELETDKAVVEVPSTVSGVVSKVHVGANDDVKVGQTILSVEEGEGAGAAADAGADEAEDADDGDEAVEDEAEAEAEEDGDVEGSEAHSTERGEKRARKPEPERARKPEPERARKPEPERDVAAGVARESRSLIPAAPSVRRMAREEGVDIADVPGSGLLGRISADDVRRFAAGEGAPEAERPAAAPAAPKLPDFGTWGETERKPLSGIGKAMAKSMGTAWTNVPMVTHFDKADSTDFEALRHRHKGAAEAVGAKLTPTAMLIKVVAGALRKFPQFNASIDVERQEIVYKRYVNIGVAVDTEHGLLVPVIKDADRKSIIELARELGELAERARDRKLGQDDMTGGNFSVSNLGGIGGTGFTPIVNPPDVAILGVSRGTLEPVWDDERETFVPRMMLPLSLTYDHRLIDGASAARFLRWICRAVEEPFLLALEG
jgi:pyruvate dehydrogenase E2 component (dihydrolipoamide acetyltransferase)